MPDLPRRREGLPVSGWWLAPVDGPPADQLEVVGEVALQVACGAWGVPAAAWAGPMAVADLLDGLEQDLARVHEGRPGKLHPGRGVGGAQGGPDADDRVGA